MIVERRCPTCISLAMLGEEKSTSTFCGLSTGGFTPLAIMPAIEPVSVLADKEILMKPLGAEVAVLIIGLTGIPQIIRSATSLGATGPEYPSSPFSALDRDMALLHWKSPWEGLPQRVITEAASLLNSGVEHKGKAAEMAASNTSFREEISPAESQSTASSTGFTTSSLLNFTAEAAGAPALPFTLVAFLPLETAANFFCAAE
mmetsp:Transcript_109366/g.214359  ORF Transcript_109366/g.214359 Transcript_109366/m.214359 type:complete len:203 (-) Transcript_109366:759-1367(-)